MKKGRRIAVWSVALLIVAALAITGARTLLPGDLVAETSGFLLHDEPVGAKVPDRNARPTTRLTVYPGSAPDAPARVMADVAVDEDFVAQVGEDWETQARRMVEEANSLLEQVGLSIQVMSVQQWRSEDGQDSIAAHLSSAEEQVERGPGRLLLAIVCEDTVKYDGWAQKQADRVIVRFYHTDQHRNPALISHEVGHVLGARHHEDERECTEQGCIMDARGYAHATTWCQHHQQVIQENIASMLADQGTEVGL